MPYQTECPACSGFCQTGCDQCGGSGCLELTGCPRQKIPREAWEMVDAAEMYALGLPPEHGGTLDQASDFVKACRTVWNEEERVKRMINAQ